MYVFRRQWVNLAVGESSTEPVKKSCDGKQRQSFPYRFGITMSGKFVRQQIIIIIIIHLWRKE